jgi:branched-chain amino acid transport system permease protein
VEAALTILLDGLQFSSYLFIVSAGLTIIFGVMKILNVAHGSFYAWGAYTAAFFIGKFSDMGLPDALGFLIIVAAAYRCRCHSWFYHRTRHIEAHV